MWEERKGDDAVVLVASEELALDSAALDVLFEPCERLGSVGLRRPTKMRSLGHPTNRTKAMSDLVLVLGGAK